MNESSVAVLFARKDSIYKTIPDCDVWDKERDALKWPGGCPVIAHPPCRAWGRLAHFANPEPGERELALWAVDQVRRWGGVLEHPEKSRVWQERGLPLRGLDEHGGFTLWVDQRWWGHRANKATWLYICGINPRRVPEYPLRLDEGTHCIKRHNKTTSRNKWKARLPTPEREATPPAFALWLVELARRIGNARHDKRRVVFRFDTPSSADWRGRENWNYVEVPTARGTLMIPDLP